MNVITVSFGVGKNELDLYILRTKSVYRLTARLYVVDVEGDKAASANILLASPLSFMASGVGVCMKGMPLTAGLLVGLKLNLELNLEQKHHSKPYIKLVIALQ